MHHAIDVMAGDIYIYIYIEIDIEQRYVHIRQKRNKSDQLKIHVDRG